MRAESAEPTPAPESALGEWCSIPGVKQLHLVAFPDAAVARTACGRIKLAIAARVADPMAADCCPRCIAEGCVPW
jgi:hypothetical protein